jgi:adenosine deaminase
MEKFRQHAQSAQRRTPPAPGLLNTDDRSITNVTLEQEYARHYKHFAWTDEQLIACNREALRAAFIDDRTRARLLDRLAVQQPLY